MTDHDKIVHEVASERSTRAELELRSIDEDLSKAHVPDEECIGDGCWRLTTKERVKLIILENQQLRELLAFAHAGGHLYADDGELQDSTKVPVIDFKRDDTDTIKYKILQRNLQALNENKAPPEA